MCILNRFLKQVTIECMEVVTFSRRFYPKRLTIAFRLYIFISMCVPWESNPQPFALLTQCSTTEPHRNTVVLVVFYALRGCIFYKKLSKNNSITVFLSRFSAFLESYLIFANKYVHFSKLFVQTAPHNTKACNLLKIYSSSLKSKFLCQ